MFNWCRFSIIDQPRNRKNKLTMLVIWVPFPALPSSLHEIRDKSPLLNSCKINTEILGLTVLPLSSSNHKLIKNSSQEQDQDQDTASCANAQSCVARDLQVWSFTHRPRYTRVYLYSVHGSMQVTPAVSANVPPLKCFYLGIHIRGENTRHNSFQKTWG